MFNLVIQLLTDLVGILNVYIPFVLIMNIACDLLFDRK